MLSFGICASIVSALVAGTLPATIAPTVWSDDSLRIEHAAEIVSSDRGLTYLETEDSNVWGVHGTLDASRLYCVVFDTCGTANIEDDRVLLAVAMD